MPSERFSSVIDTRQEIKTDHLMHDVLMSGFAMMFFHDPSLLQFQQRMEDEAHMNNLTTLFQIQSIPGDTRMREVIDQVLGGRYIVALDGSQYFTSEKVSCSGCLFKMSIQGREERRHPVFPPDCPGSPHAS
jgi:hypothetical protein